MSEPQIILCPGQGAQRVGMGKAWFDAWPEAAQTFAAADEALGDRLGARLSDICFNGPAERLDMTDVAQPAIYTVSVACHQALVGAAGGEAPNIAAVAGLSLGEYTALHIAGAITFEDGLELVALRGRAMQDAAESQEGGMVALIGADEQQARDLCEAVAPPGDDSMILSPANFNAPGQIVLSGHAGACDRAVEEAATRSLRATRLSVAGAFHSALMAPAADRLAAALQKTTIKPPRRPVISNVTALPHDAADDGAGTMLSVEDEIRRRLVEQLTSPVRWDGSCRWLAANMQGEFHELAPGRVLAGLMKRIDRNVKVTTHDEPES